MLSELWLQGQAAEVVSVGDLSCGGLPAAQTLWGGQSAGWEAKGSSLFLLVCLVAVCSCTPALSDELFLLFIPCPSSFRAFSNSFLTLTAAPSAKISLSLRLPLE